jgi:mono/diheme cytochrome c family protein
MIGPIVRFGRNLFWTCVPVFLLSLITQAGDSASLYKTKCVACHAADGSGNTPAGKKLAAHDLRSAEVQKMSDADLTEIIAKGKNKMPGYEKTLKPDDIKGLVAYIRSLAAPQ